ncbi:isoliquiritigenin 2'-O-methyltransferase-like [Neltuma alba]|uniref:isoliquiritigenin 2'-O-methyltransferase-like n=1 Tax=Neltuma alba TaxID=207710 RepID=UPI0010A37BD8|nr:isoliquiritigenin 2'-O-methyltransferase-like [Prosopis alba]
MSTNIENHEYDSNSSSFNPMMLPTDHIYLAVLNAAIELNLFEIIGKGSPKGMSSSEIASKLENPHASMANRLDRMLFLLSNYSLLICSYNKLDQPDKIERLYSISPHGKYLIVEKDETSCVRFFKLCNHPTYIKIWQNFKQVILDEEENLFKKVHGMPMYKYMEMDPTFKTTFHKAMADLSIMQIKDVLETYEGFEGISTLVDVAGGVGQNLKMIISKYPSIQGINFDLPHVVQHGLSHPGMKHLGGDMFKSVPEGDAMMMKFITHNWGDEKCIQILRNCHRSLKNEGKLIIIDPIMPEIPNGSDEHKYVSVLDNLMFLQSGGKERTEKEFEALCKDSGFSSYRIAAHVAYAALGVIEFYK